ncbi:DUF1707 and DUF4870 domain-containing protein [Nocardiopsis composta]|uniref:Putative Tic20 family protein n=1 Tax=Nocardiopsis composta TaxID=157465 RepID=A0A7W8VES5_9ACTN|nr:DUF1707 and DUF4870 domain-containing protein [Nocardiopsis composta]MBB5433647.1 putative Tic20 family protein [Nocardiopsis composta]
MAVHDPIPRPGRGPAGGSQVPQIRLTHADRDAAAEQLRQAFSEGRLDEEEFDERIDAALKAKFPADLEPLLRDVVPVHPQQTARVPGAAQAPAVPEGPVTGAERVWGAAAHVSGYLLLPLGPLLVLLLQGDTSPFVRRHAMEALNYQLTTVIGCIVGFGLFFLVLPAIAAVLMLLGWMFLPAVAGLVTLLGSGWKYPFTWRPVKDR